MLPLRPDPDRIMMEVAGGQHGVVGRSQLLRCGVPSHVIEHRLRKGWLRRLHRGVYGVGPVAAPLEREAAAVLACGEEALLTGAAAGALMGFGTRPSPREPVDVVVVGGGHPSAGEGIRVRRTRSLPVDERSLVQGIRTTSPERTLLEIAATGTARETEQALAAAERAGVVRGAVLRQLLERYPRRTGTAIIRRLLAREQGPSFSRSEAESVFSRLVTRAELPPPEMNRRVRGMEVDFLWQEARLIVEIDGYRFHRGTAAFERDRSRDRELVTAGYTVLRFTWRRITGKPEQVVAQVAWCLGRSGVAPAWR